VQCAECREHRRWIERENGRLRARGKKDEAKRIREFVDLAYATDPRIKAHKLQLKEEREQRKRQKAAAAAARAEAEQRVKAEAAAAEAARAEEEAAAAEEQKKARCVQSSFFEQRFSVCLVLCSNDGGEQGVVV
jgi:DnaJ homolog subfamily C member 2